MTKYNEKINLNDRNSLSILLNRICPNSVILEFGPAAGRMTEFLSIVLNCNVYAVEIDVNAAKVAEKFTEKIVIDSIENYTWEKEFENLKFDYIIFADVLEHLYNPEEVLVRVRNFLKSDGSILISIPNIAHNAIILGLMKNEFNYSPLGLLDNTHIRFYTKQTFDEIILKNNYFIYYETAIYINPKNTEFKNNYDEIPREFNEYLSNLPWGEVYQYIYEIKNHEVEKTSDFHDNFKIYAKNYSQLFIENDNESLKDNFFRCVASKDSGIQRFEFDLSNQKNIVNLVFYPFNDSCVIEIREIYLILDDDSILDLKNNISTNACSYYNNKYFFETFDPKVYFTNIDFTNFLIKKFVVELNYCYVMKDAVHICANQIANDRNSIIQVQKQNIQDLDFKLKRKDIIENQLAKDLEKNEQRYQNLADELINIYLSKSWKFTRILRTIIRKIKKELNV